MHCGLFSHALWNIGEDNLCDVTNGFHVEVPMRDAELSLVDIQFLNHNMYYYGNVLFRRPHDNYFGTRAQHSQLR